MAYYYVKSGFGTSVAVASSTIERTGAFSAMTASDTYASLSDVLLYNTMATGDVIRYAHDHSVVYGIDKTWAFLAGVSNESVDNLACDEYKIGANEAVDTISSNLDLAITGAIGAVLSFHGMTIQSGKDIVFTTGEATYFFNDCEIFAYNTGTSIALTAGDGQRLRLNNTILNTYGSVILTISRGNMLECNGLTWNDTSSSTLPKFSMGGLGGSYFSFINTIFNFTATLTSLFYSAAPGADNISIVMRRCFLPNFTSVMPVTTLINYNIDMYSSGVGNKYYNEYNERYNGSSDIDDVVYLTAKYDGTNYVSRQINTNSNCSGVSPLKVKIYSNPAIDLTSAKTIKINILTDVTTLTDADIWPEAVYNDNTNLAKPVVNSGMVDFLSGTNLTTNTEAWTETLTTPIKQEIEITVPTGLTNVSNGTLDIFIVVAIANKDIWVCPDVVVT